MEAGRHLGKVQVLGWVFDCQGTVGELPRRWQEGLGTAWCCLQPSRPRHSRHHNRRGQGGRLHKSRPAVNDGQAGGVPDGEAMLPPLPENTARHRLDDFGSFPWKTWYVWVVANPLRYENPHSSVCIRSLALAASSEFYF